MSPASPYSTPSFPEADWRVFREVRIYALERFCQRVLEEIRALSAAPGQSQHERYLSVYDRLQSENDEMSFLFDGARRSRALMQLIALRRVKLLTDEEFARFSSETRELVENLLTL